MSKNHPTQDSDYASAIGELDRSDTHAADVQSKGLGKLARGTRFTYGKNTDRIFIVVRASPTRITGERENHPGSITVIQVDFENINVLADAA